LTLSEAVAETGWTRARIENLASNLSRQGQVLRIGDRLLGRQHLAALQEHVVAHLENFHSRNPLVPGISRQELHDTVGSPDEVFSAILDSLTKQKKVEVAGETVRLAGRGVVMKDEEAESKKAIETAFSSTGLAVPALNQVLAGLKIDKSRAQKLVTLLLRDKVLVKVSDELVFHRAALDQLRAQLATYKQKSPKIDVGKFKELTGVSRKYAIPLLEYLDRERVTKRVGDERIIL
jgi:selenocysteine-specific elongation factor